MRFFSKEQKHFVQLTVGIWCATLVGTTYAFGVLSNEMKKRFHLSQGDITTISTVGMALNFFTFPAGVTFDRWGPRVVNSIATILMALGFIGNALIFMGKIPGTTTTLTIAAALTFSTSGWFDIGTLMTNLFNFPRNRGEIIILQKTFMGLGAAFYSVIYTAFFDGDFTGYSFFVAGTIVVIGFSGIVFVRLPPIYETTTTTSQNEDARDTVRSSAINYNESEECVLDVVDLDNLDMRRFNVGLGLLACNMVLLLSISLVDALVDIPRSVHIALGVTALVFVGSFVILPLLPNRRATVTEQAPLLDNASVWQRDGVRASQHTRHSAASPPFGNTPRMKPQAAPGSPSDAHPDDELLQHLTPRTFMESLRGARLWLLWFISFAVWGAGIVVILNVSQIYRAANDNVYVDRTNAMYVALTGIASALGRIFIGISEKIIRRRLGVAHIVRLLPVPGVLTFVSTVTLLFMPASGLAFPFVLSSFAFGASWAVTVLMTRVMFTVDVGKHYNFMFLGGLTALLVFNRGMFGTLYEREGDAQGLTPDCSGIVCYRVTFIALSAVNVVGVFCAFFVLRGWLGELKRLKNV